MKKRLRAISIEAIWLILSAFLSIVLAKFYFGWTGFKDSIDIPLHDSFFVFSSWFVLLPIFLFLTFVIYFVKEINKSFNRSIPNWIILISGVAVIITLTLIVKLISDFGLIDYGGWTAYPPLSALPNQEPQIGNSQTFIARISYSLILAQFIILIMLLYTTYRWGHTKNSDLKS